MLVVSLHVFYSYRSNPHQISTFMWKLGYVSTQNRNFYFWIMRPAWLTFFTFYKLGPNPEVFWEVQYFHVSTFPGLVCEAPAWLTPRENSFIVILEHQKITFEMPRFVLSKSWIAGKSNLYFHSPLPLF